MNKLFDDYTVVNGSDSRRESAQADLEAKVLVYMEAGWIPLGGVVYVGTETIRGFTCQVFCQAMGKPAQEPDDPAHGFYAGTGSLAYVPVATEPDDARAAFYRELERRRLGPDDAA